MNQEDWHPADIIAGLKKKGTSLSALSRQSGYAACTLGNVLLRSWTRGELIIANKLGVTPEEIWPSRYQKTRYLRDRRKPSHE
ncbi:helix-turn-helix transcriptional regulator [Utexia brackfieldae]|uniref:helix-turn-helix domain-containing protein n=1 Tax=Utexia brackfieldae TaxID=3074108 RepID=UPI00370D27B9